MKDLVTLAIGFLLLGALIAWCTRTQAPVIQADIRARTEIALAIANLNNVHVAVDGRDVTLSGTVVGNGDAGRAFAIADAVRGVRIVDGNLGIEAPKGAAKKELGDSGDRAN